MTIINTKLTQLAILVNKSLPALALVVTTGYSSISYSADPIMMVSSGNNSAATAAGGSTSDLTRSDGLKTVFVAVGSGHGMYADTNGTIKESTVGSVFGSYSDGGDAIRAETGGKIILGSDTKIVAGYNYVLNDVSSVGGDGSGIVVNGQGSTVKLTGKTEIKVYGRTGMGIFASDGGEVEVNGFTEIITNGVGIKANEASTVNLNGQVNLESSDSFAISAFDGSKISIGINDNLSTIKSLTPDLVELDGSANNGELSFIYSELTATGNVFNAKNGGWVVTLDNSKTNAGSDVINLSGSSDIILNAKNGSVLTGNLTATSGSALHMTLDQSTLTGQALGQNQIDLIMNNGSSWNMTESSQINSLAFSNGLNEVYFSAPSGNAYKVLTTNSLSGNGAFYINTYLNEGGANTQSDLIHVTGNASGSHTLYVNASGNGAYTEDSNGNNVGIKVVQIDGLSTSQFALGNEVSIGAFDYYLHEGLQSDPADQNWYLRNEIPVPGEGGEGGEGNGGSNPNPGPDVTNPVGPTTKPAPTPYRKEVPGYIISPMVNLLYGYQTVGTLHERMGDTQQFARGYDQKTWGRYGGQHLESKAGRFNYDIDMMFAQFGRDLYQQETEAGTAVTAGATVTLGRTQTDARDKVRTYVGDSIYTGGVTTNAYSIGGYYTRYAQDGGYIDAVTQFTYYDTHYSSRYDAHQKSYGLLLSLEGGKPYEVTQNWKIEPQGQIAYQFIKSEDFSDQISDISGDNNNSGLARAGLRFFRDRAEDKTNETFKPYLTLDAVSLLSKAPSVNVGGTNVRPDFDTSWWQAGAGITTNVEKNTSFYLDVKYQKSFEGDLDGYSAHIGVQARF